MLRQDCEGLLENYNVKVYKSIQWLWRFIRALQPVGNVDNFMGRGYEGFGLVGVCFWWHTAYCLCTTFPRNVRKINLVELESLVYLDSSVSASSNRLRVQVCPLHMFLHINCVSTSIFGHGVEAGIHEVPPTSAYRTGMKDCHLKSSHCCHRISSPVVLVPLHGDRAYRLLNDVGVAALAAGYSICSKESWITD